MIGVICLIFLILIKAVKLISINLKVYLNRKKQVNFRILVGLIKLLIRNKINKPNKHNRQIINKNKTKKRTNNKKVSNNNKRTNNRNKRRWARKMNNSNKTNPKSNHTNRLANKFCNNNNNSLRHTHKKIVTSNKACKR